MRRFVCVAIALALAFLLAITVTAFAAETTDYQGTYVGSVRTSTNSEFGAWVQVYDLGNGRLKFVVKVGSGPTLPLWPKVPVERSGFVHDRDERLRALASWGYKPLVDGSGSATFVKSRQRDGPSPAAVAARPWGSRAPPQAPARRSPMSSPSPISSAGSAATTAAIARGPRRQGAGRRGCRREAARGHRRGEGGSRRNERSGRHRRSHPVHGYGSEHVR